MARSAVGIQLALAMVVASANACRSGRGSRGTNQNDPLSELRVLAAPSAQPTGCHVVPDSIVEFVAARPIILCFGGNTARPAYGLMRDRSGRTVWFTRASNSRPRPAAMAEVDSLAGELAGRFGTPLRCSDERRQWSLSGFVIDLVARQAGDVVRQDELWHVELTGQLGGDPCAA